MIDRGMSRKETLLIYISDVNVHDITLIFLLLRS